jgi:hypothetical protein
MYNILRMHWQGVWIVAGNLPRFLQFNVPLFCRNPRLGMNGFNNLSTGSIHEQ